MKHPTIIMLCALLLSIVSATETGRLLTSDDQLFWVNGSWLPADQVKVGDKFMTPEGKVAVVKSTQDVTSAENASCYGLLSENPHDFFANDVLAHDGSLSSREQANAEMTAGNHPCSESISARQGGPLGRFWEVVVSALRNVVSRKK